MKNERYSRSEIERALRAADAPEDSMATDEDQLRYVGRAEAVAIFRHMLGLCCPTLGAVGTCSCPDRERQIGW